jgi:hypothetical protein
LSDIPLNVIAESIAAPAAHLATSAGFENEVVLDG